MSDATLQFTGFRSTLAPLRDAMAAWQVRRDQRRDYALTLRDLGALDDDGLYRLGIARSGIRAEAARLVFGD